MDVEALVEKAKRHRVIIALVAIGASLAFVASFGKNLMEVCGWLSLCGPSLPPSAISYVATGRARAFVEQSTVLGPPQYLFAKSIYPELDAEFELESDEREVWDEMFEALGSGKFEDAKAYYKTLYEYATYRNGSLNYVFRYKRKTQEVSAILLEALADTDSCVDDLRQLPDLKPAFAYGKKFCVGKTTFGELLSGAHPPIKSPLGPQFSPASCWGDVSKGGAGGAGSGIVVTCKRHRQSQADERLSYLIRFSSVGGEYEEDLEFNDESPDSKAYAAFLAATKSAPVKTVVIFDPQRL